MKSEADTSALELLHEWLLPGLSCIHSPEHTDTQRSRFSGPQSQTQASTDRLHTLQTFIYTWVSSMQYIILKKKKGPSNVKSLAKSPKSALISSSVYFQGSFAREISSQRPPRSPFLGREAGLELGCERCECVFCGKHSSTTQWDTARGQRERRQEPHG